MNVLPLLKTPLVDVCQAIVDGNLDKVEFEDKASVCKYIVPDGYPETEYAGELIEVDEDAIEDMGAKVFYAAVSAEDDGIHLSGSRALGIVASGDSIEEAEKIAEKACEFVKGNVYHRRDVGTAELVNKRVEHMKEILN
jgi:phosphoribosylamine--glycine ligase